MKKAALVASISLLLVIAGLLSASLIYKHMHVEKVSNASQQVVKPPTRAELLQLVNQERAKNGVALLKEDALLDKSAQWKADDEVKFNYFGHVKPGTTGIDGLAYLNSFSPPCVYVSENLTENTNVNDSKHAIDAWISSPVHHQAMIDTKYSLTGFGISGQQIVEHFCQQ